MSLAWQASGVLHAGGKALEYACWGPPPSEAGTFVLLHEGLGCVALWRDFPQALSKATGWGVFAYSRAGYGQSDPADLPRPLDYMTREAVDVLPEVLAEVGSRHTVLVGHSDGATIAMIHGGLVRDRHVRGIVAMAPHFFTEPMGLAAIGQAREAFGTGDMRQRMARYHKDPETAFRGWNDAWLDPAFKDWDVRDVINEVAVPVLAIQGREDEYGTLAQIDVIAERASSRVERLVLDQCRHAPFLDEPELVLKSVSSFGTGLIGASPPHSYIPGHTVRHPEGWFDPVRQTAQDGMSEEALSRTSAFRTGCAYLADGYFWEAHEVLEPVWMVLPEGSDARSFVQALIQLANGELKLRMGKPKAAKRLAEIARGLLSGLGRKAVMGIRVSDIADQVDSLHEQALLLQNNA